MRIFYATSPDFLRRFVGVCGLSLLIPALLAGCTSDLLPVAATAELTAVVTTHVQQREHSVAIEAVGTTHARESVLITSRVSGRVSRIFLVEGAHVAEGTALVQLEDDTERAGLRAAAAAAAEAQSQLERLDSLSARGLVSQYERDRQVRAMEAAQAELELRRVLLDQRTIRAPFAGVVGFRQVSPGTLVQPGTSIVSLDACEEMRVHFSIPETLIGALQRSQSVDAVTAAYPGRTYRGRITARGTRVDEMTRAVPAQAIFANDDGSLLPGMMLTVRIQTPARSLTYLPEAALAPENARQYVWRIDAAGAAERVPVEIGLRELGWVEIASGIDVGDRIVVEGGGNLRPGTRVREIPSPGASFVSAGAESH